jgi:putative endonuclease
MKEHRPYFVYIMTNQPRGVLYIGMTVGLLERVESHQKKVDPFSFTARYNIRRLVYFETYQYVEDAIRRETCLKRWKRAWKIELIESVNPKWDDLFEQLKQGTYEERYSPLRDKHYK